MCGTDPVEGAALAISILTDLLNRGIHTMATTHYSELKMFALSTEGIENACCEFDVETLSPTFHLLVGIPGKSNAFAISTKLGLDPMIIEQANAQIDDSVQDFETLLADLEKSKRQIEEEQEQIYNYKKEIEDLQNSLKQKQDDIKEKRAKILQEAREEAYHIISEAKDVADEAIKKYNSWGKHPEQKNTKRMEHKRSDLRSHMKKLEKSMSYQGKKSKPPAFQRRFLHWRFRLCIESESEWRGRNPSKCQRRSICPDGNDAFTRQYQRPGNFKKCKRDQKRGTA